MNMCKVMIRTDWSAHFPYRCYFYPGRDLPGWEAGGLCGRIGNLIPADETDQPEEGDW